MLVQVGLPVLFGLPTLAAVTLFGVMLPVLVQTPLFSVPLGMLLLVALFGLVLVMLLFGLVQLVVEQLR